MNPIDMPATADTDRPPGTGNPVADQEKGTADPAVAAPAAATRRPVPPPPATLQETGLTEEFVAGLLLKALYTRGARLGLELSDLLALPMGLLDDILRDLQERRLVEVPATRGPSRSEFVFGLTGQGRVRAAEEMEISRYVGPAPVPFEDFCTWTARQALDEVRIGEGRLREALEGVVVPEETLELLGPAINSGRSLFLFGSPGNGKTLLSERIARLFGETYFVPYAVLVDGAVMIVHDPVHHAGAEGPADRQDGPPEGSLPDGGADPRPESGGSNGRGPTRSVRQEIVRALPDHDRRFSEARRPVVVTGGELTLDQLDLRWDPAGRMYQAPPQLKAAGGVLVVDDLGRQRVPVEDLLNRWVVPLEQRRDYLTLRSGRKLVVPFDAFVIFSTNLEPEELGDEAFLRRIHYKIHVTSPDRDEFSRIFRECCHARSIAFDEEAVDWLFQRYYGEDGVEPRRCHPRDVLDHLVHLSDFRGEPPALAPGLLEPACRSYFLPSG